jgi:hypothetical protein
MRRRCSEVNIKLEQIIDGTTECKIWFFINVADRECILSVNEQSDGSAVIEFSSVDDLLKIPEDFYVLTDHQKTGANACVFNAFHFKEQKIALMKGVTAEEVLAQGLFEPVAGVGELTINEAGKEHKTSAAVDYAVLADPEMLLDAFERWGLKKQWFRDVAKHPWLKEAKRVSGKPGRGGFPAYYCPHAVMQGMLRDSRKSKLSEKQGWKILENKFSKAYLVFEPLKPDFQQSE